MKQALGIAEMETEVHMPVILFVSPLEEMEEGVEVEVQVVYLNSASEVGDIRDVFDVLPKIGGEFHRPWSSPDKTKLKMKLEWRFQAEDTT